MAYELLTGTRPFADDNIAALARAHVEDEPRRPGLGPAVDGVLLRGLEKEPSRRWPTAGAMVDALEQALAAERPALAADRPLGGRRGAGPFARLRNPEPVVVLGSVLAALLLAGIVLALTGGDGGTRTAADGRAGTRTQPAPDGERERETASSNQPAAVSEDPAALNDEGFALMNAGRPGDAIPLLARAVDAYGADGGDDLTYAYALYNLGRSLRLAGRPGDAIPVLERRMAIDNQRDVVARELEQARRDAGVGGGGKKPKKTKGEG